MNENTLMKEDDFEAGCAPENVSNIPFDGEDNDYSIDKNESDELDDVLPDQSEEAETVAGNKSKEQPSEPIKSDNKKSKKLFNKKTHKSKTKVATTILIALGVFFGAGIQLGFISINKISQISGTSFLTDSENLSETVSSDNNDIITPTDIAIEQSELSLKISDVASIAQNNQIAIENIKIHLENQIQDQIENLAKSEDFKREAMKEEIYLDITGIISKKVSALESKIKQQSTHISNEQSAFTSKLINLETEELKTELIEIIDKKLATSDLSTADTKAKPTKSNVTTTTKKEIELPTKATVQTSFLGYKLKDIFSWSSENVAVLSEGLGMATQVIEGDALDYEHVIVEITPTHIDIENIHSKNITRLIL